LKTEPSEREKAIGRRLRTFRESLTIPRTAFALKIGISGERLASYEAGRVPLRWDVFSVVAERYRLNPRWLATGESEPTLDFPFRPPYPFQPRMLFSELYDRFLSGRDAQLIVEIQIRLLKLSNSLGEAMGIIVKGVLPAAVEKKIGELLKEVADLQAGTLDEVLCLVEGVMRKQFKEGVQGSSQKKKRRNENFESLGLLPWALRTSRNQWPRHPK